MSKVAQAKWVALGPVVLASTALVLTVGPVLPAVVGLVGFVLGLGGTVLLSTAVGERAWVRLMCRARPLRGEEAGRAAALVAAMCAAQVGAPLVDLYVVDARAVSAASVGRRSVIISTGLIDVVGLGQVSPIQGAAVAGEAVGQLRMGHTRWDLALQWWTLPWQVIEAFATGVARGFARLPLFGYAWKMRFVVCTIAFVQSLATRTTPGYAAAVTLCVVLGSTYAVPVARRAWRRRLDLAVDEFLCAHQLGAPLAEVLTRRGRLPAERAARLRGTRAPVAPQLGLVGGPPR